MTPREIIGELGEALGICDQVQLLRRINRAVELLSAKDLFDPLVGYLNFQVDQGNFIALPREVRSVLAVNINNNPSFARNRFYEFDLSSPGTVTGDAVQWEWNDRCNVVVQDEQKFPGKLTYRCALAGDNGKTCTIEGRDATGRIIRETIAAHNTTPVESVAQFHEATRVYRDETGGECLLYCAGELIAQYYGDETEPVYRSIRLSRSVASVRIMFRREPLRITTLDSYVPLNSPMAVIQAAKAVGHLTAGEDDKADACLARAEKFIAEDQASREEGDKLADSRQAVGVLGVGLGHSEGISVLDVYDTTAEIFGAIGRPALFKKISQAVQVLLGKAHWDGLLGIVDIWPRSNETAINALGGTGHGYYTLPRFIGTPLKVNLCGQPLVARNQWFDFNLNGSGERTTANVGKWDDLGDTPLMDFIPRVPGTGRTVPSYFMALCDNSLDEGKLVRIYGREQLDSGECVEVWRNGQRGWCAPCKVSLLPPGDDWPKWVEVEKIERAETRGFVRLWAYFGTLSAGTPEVDLTTISTGYVLTGTWSGNHQGVRVYATVVGSNTVAYGDAAMTIEIGRAALVGAPSPTQTNPITFSLNGLTFNGTWKPTVHSPFVFTIVRTVTSAIAGSWSFTKARLLGLWYPDEIEPSYRLIRLPATHPLRIRVLYRKHFRRICSLYEPIPLRSSLAVENMLRAVKAQEMGLVTNAEPLEMKAVQYLSEDRIKEGENEMPTLEFDMSTAPGGFENIN